MSTNKPNQDGRFDSVGRCVYCKDSSSRLTDEHIVPYSLLGREILPKASCESCQKITSRFERICARTMFNSLRIREKLPTRRKKERPTSIPVVTNHGEIHLGTNDTFATRPIVALLQAGFLQRPPVRKIGFAGARLSVQMSQPASKDSWSRNKLTEMSIAQTFHLESLARLYAKICHCYAVAVFGVDHFEHWLPDYILGKDPHLSYVVGGTPGSEQPLRKTYQLSWRIYEQINDINNLIVVNIRLFSFLGGPWSHVVVGTATEDLVHKLRQNS